jgi:autotransporter-associated beta strand protein
VVRLQPLSFNWLGLRTRVLLLAAVSGAAGLTIWPSPDALAACSPTASTGPVTPPSGTTVTCSGTTINQNPTTAAAYGTGDQGGLTINVGATGSPAIVQGVSTTGASATAFAGIKVSSGNTINIAAGSTVTSDGSAALVTSGGTILNNAGTISTTAAGQFAISTGGIVFTNSGTVQGDNGIVSLNGGNTIINSGTFNTPLGAISISSGGNTLQLLPGSSITGNVSMTSNSTLDLSGTGSASFNASNIGTQYTGFNTFTKTGASTWTLTGSGNQAWTISAGTLVGDTTSIQGSITNNAALTFNQTFNGTYGAAIGGTGGVTKQGTGTVTFSGGNTYSGGTTINAGALAVSADNNLGNSAGGLAFGGGSLQFLAGFTTNRAITLNAGGGAIDTGANAVTLGGTIGGTDGLTKIGAGALTVTGAGTYLGATAVTAGTLKAGVVNAFSASSAYTVGGATLDLNNFSQSIGSLAGGAGALVTLGSAALTTGADGSSTTFQGAITGTGGLTKAGAGSFTLAGTENYFGPTNVNAGGLSVTGTISNSSINVNSGGTLLGTGTVGAVNVASGGNLMPGLPGTVGTLNVTGNLVFASAAAYLISINGANASTTSINGTAGLAGANLIVANGSTLAFGKKYTILTAQGGVSGTFNASVSFGRSVGAITYDAKDVFLTFANPPTLTSLLPSGSPVNVFNVAGAIDKFASSGAAVPGGFQSLFNLAPQQLVGALTQLSGEAATGAQAGGFQLMTSFMSLLTGSSGGTGNAGGPALPFAPERADAIPSDVALAYASVLKAPPMAYAPHWSSWGAPFGGGNSTNGNPSVGGSHDITARTGGFAAGLDYHASPGTIFGVAMAGGGTNWSLSAGLGGGRSDVFLAGLYGSKQWGQAYVSGALTYASNWVSTSRNITVAGADALSASFNAQTFGGRLEGGYRVPSALAVSVIPYAAVQAQSFRSPAYSESGALGPADPFALSYASQTATLVRSELGSRFDRNVALSAGSSVDLFGRAAWAHDWQSNPNLSATFIGLPTATFVVNGVAPPSNVALLTAGAEWHSRNGWSFLAKFEGEFANRSDTYTGTARVKYSW